MDVWSVQCYVKVSNSKKISAAPRRSSMSQQVEVTSSTSCEENHNASLYKRTKNQLNYLRNVARDQLLQQALDMMEIRPPPVQDCCPVYLRSLTHSRRSISRASDPWNRSKFRCILKNRCKIMKKAKNLILVLLWRFFSGLYSPVLHHVKQKICSIWYSNHCNQYNARKRGFHP